MILQPEQAISARSFAKAAGSAPPALKGDGESKCFGVAILFLLSLTTIIGALWLFKSGVGGGINMDSFLIMAKTSNALVLVNLNTTKLAV